jgi:hypothetical protein
VDLDPDLDPDPDPPQNVMDLQHWFAESILHSAEICLLFFCFSVWNIENLLVKGASSCCKKG